MIFDLSSLGAHQNEGLEACISGFQRHDRLQVHMACGTGKTRLGQAVAYELESCVTLLLFPSLPLTSQTLESWIQEGGISHQDILCVCSDPSVVDQDEDDHVLSVPIAVTTDPTDVGEFFRGRNAGQATYIFCTYHSLPSLALGLPDWLEIDLCVFDEAHRVVGAVDKSFTYGLNNHVDLRISKRLFLTATPRLIATEQGHEDQVYSMSDESVFGPVAYHLSLHEAIERGIICDYQIIVSLQDESIIAQEGIETDEQDLVFKAASLLQTMEKVHANKAFTFHQRISYSKRFNEALKVVAHHRDKELSAWHVDGAMTEGERHHILRLFSDVPTGVVSCSRCLSEGTNVPVTDLVAFMDPRGSDTDIIQTLGRALRKAPGKTMGFVLIPLKLVVGQTVEQILNSSAMRHIWRVLGSVAELDERFVNQLRKIRREVPPSQWSEAPLQMLEKISIQASREVTEETYRSLRFQLVDRLTSRWESSYGELIRYSEVHGHARVPKRYTTPTGFRLGAWCAVQRMLFKASVLDADRKSELLKLGFDFDPKQTSWDEAMDALLAYHCENGRANPPQSYETPCGFSLGAWCDEQRKAYKAKKLSADRVAALEEIEFSFSPSEEAWNSNFEKLRDYKQRFGTLDLINLTEVDRKLLHSWIENQRKRRIPVDRREKLESIGVKFSSKSDQAWEAGFAHLESYLNENAGEHPSLNFRTPSGFALGNWVSNQRQAFAAGKMPEIRRLRLQKIEFVFNVEEAAFEKGLEQLLLYKAEHGHCRVPSAHVSPSGYKLGAWCGNIRSRATKSLGDEKKKRLQTIGFLE